MAVQLPTEPSPEVVELTQRLRTVVGQAHQLSTSINETITDLREFGRFRLAAASRRVIEERRSASPLPYYGIERRRHA